MESWSAASGSRAVVLHGPDAGEPRDRLHECRQREALRTRDEAGCEVEAELTRQRVTMNDRRALPPGARRMPKEPPGSGGRARAPRSADAIRDSTVVAAAS